MTPTTPAADLDHTLIRAARLWVSHHRPYYASALFRCPIIATGDVPTCAIDQAWRIYVNPTYINGRTVTQIAAALIHEINHNLRGHGDRAITRHIPPHQQMQWNCAGDIEMNDDLRADGLDTDPTWLYPDTFGFPGGQLTERYFDLLTDRLPPPTAHEYHTCGSGAHGHREQFEQPGSSGDAGVSAADGELIRRDVAKQIGDYERAKGRGSVPAGLSRWAEHYLTPQVDWRTVLAGAIRRAIAATSGAVDYSYRRPNRRDDTRNPIIMPGMIRPVPNVAVVVDTSGSMSTTDLDHALAEIHSILRHVGVAAGGIHVIACDAAAHTSRRIFTTSQVDLIGGGGTDMGAGIEAAARHRPTCTVVLTDGETGWPATSVTRAGRTIAAIITDHPDDMTATVPTWIRTVTIRPDRT